MHEVDLPIQHPILFNQVLAVTVRLSILLAQNKDTAVSIPSRIKEFRADECIV